MSGSETECVATGDNDRTMVVISEESLSEIEENLKILSQSKIACLVCLWIPLSAVTSSVVEYTHHL